MVSLKAAGCRLAKRLPVSGAFHSPLMQSAYEPLADALSALEFQMPEIPVYSNYTAMPTTDPALLKSNALNQLLNPVRWTQTLVRMYDDDARSFTECGPGNVLRGLVQRTLKDVDVQGVE
jgi:[acyl-carrier-protein] S-malonyltransferase